VLKKEKKTITCCESSLRIDNVRQKGDTSGRETERKWRQGAVEEKKRCPLFEGDGEFITISFTRKGVGENKNSARRGELRKKPGLGKNAKTDIAGKKMEELLVACS